MALCPPRPVLRNHHKIQIMNTPIPPPFDADNQEAIRISEACEACEEAQELRKLRNEALLERNISESEVVKLARELVEIQSSQKRCWGQWTLAEQKVKVYEELFREYHMQVIEVVEASNSMNFDEISKEVSKLRDLAERVQKEILTSECRNADLLSNEAHAMGAGVGIPSAPSSSSPTKE